MLKLSCICSLKTKSLFLSLVTDQLNSKGYIQEEMRKSIQVEKRISPSLWYELGPARLTWDERTFIGRAEAREKVQRHLP